MQNEGQNSKRSQGKKGLICICSFSDKLILCRPTFGMYFLYYYTYFIILNAITLLVKHVFIVELFRI